MLSCDDCPEDKRENYQNCSVLSCVRQLCAMVRTHEQFLKMNVGLGLVFMHLFRFSILCFPGLPETILFLCCLLLFC